MKIGFYAGSFDMFTKGHLHVVKVAAEMFEKVVIGIGIHPQKKRRYDKNIMKSAIEKVLKSEGLSNVAVIIYEGLTADAALEYNAKYLIRGLRNGMDYAYEEELASTNNEISDGLLETIFLRAGNLSYVSSSMVVELLMAGKNVSKYVPKDVLDIL